MKERPLFFTLGVFGITVFALGAIISGYLSSSKEVELESCWFGNCQPEQRRTEPGRGLTGEIRAKASVSSRRALDLGEEALASIEAAGKSVTDWRERYASLPSSNAGEAITGDEALVAAFYKEWTVQPPPPANLASLKRDVDRLLEPVRDAAESDDNRFAPSEKLIAEINAAKIRADTLRSLYEEKKRALDGVLKRASAHTRGNRTLEEAQAALEEQRRAQAAENAQLASERKNALTPLALSSATRVDFHAFLRPGRWQGPRQPLADEPRPFSYRALVAAGALRDFKRFIEFATSSSNDRPREPYPTTNAQWDAARERFKKFQDYAPIWAENDWLSP